MDDSTYDAEISAYRWSEYLGFRGRLWAAFEDRFGRDQLWALDSDQALGSFLEKLSELDDELDDELHEQTEPQSTRTTTQETPLVATILGGYLPQDHDWDSWPTAKPGDGARSQTPTDPPFWWYWVNPKQRARLLGVVIYMHATPDTAKRPRPVMARVQEELARQRDAGDLIATSLLTTLRDPFLHSLPIAAVCKKVTDAGGALSFLRKLREELDTQIERLAAICGESRG